LLLALFLIIKLQKLMQAHNRCLPESRPAKSRRKRRGATTVEFAIVAIPLFLFIFASIEMGRAFMCVNSMEEAARTGCRAAILKRATEDKVEAEVAEVMDLAGISNHTVEISPDDFTTFDR